MSKRKDKTARILSSIWGASYQVEELIGGTLHYTHHENLGSATNYCRENGLTVIEIC